jgi:hypothetical protein
MGYETGTVNLALVAGDKLAVQEGRAEASLGRQNYVRLDRLSQAELAALPGAGSETYKIHLLSGRMYLRISRLDRDKEFEVHTPDASFYVLETGLYRLDVFDQGETELSVVEGAAEAAGETGSLEVRSGQSLTAKSGNLLSQPKALSAEADDFGRWNQSRDSLLLAGRNSSSYLPQELGEYGSELDQYGDWHYEADYGYVWVPDVDYYTDWHPYYYGRWVWYPIIGWTWIADEPWGWCVSHYGRWHWGHNLGWYWIPSRHWGPAWVHWYWDNDYLGWCPLNYWNRPAVVINNVFYGNYGHDYYSVHNRAMTVISRNQLQARRMSDVALRGGALERIGRVSLSGRQPGIRPMIARSGRATDQARRTFEHSGLRSVDRVYSGRAFGNGGRFSGSDAERNIWRSSSSGRASSGRGVATSRRLSTFNTTGTGNNRATISSRRISEFTSSRAGSVPFQGRSFSSTSTRSQRSTLSRRSLSGQSTSSLPREFSSRFSSRRTFSSNPSSSRLTSTGGSSPSRGSALNREFSSSGRISTYSSRPNLSSSGRTSSFSNRFSSRSSSSPSNRSSVSNYFNSRRTESTLRRSSSWPSSSRQSRSSSTSNRSTYSSPQSYSSPSRNYSFSRPSSSFSNRSTSSPGRSSSSSSHSFSSSGHSSSSHSSSGRSSSSGSQVRRRNR